MQAHVELAKFGPGSGSTKLSESSGHGRHAHVGSEVDWGSAGGVPNKTKRRVIDLWLTADVSTIAPGFRGL
jgi:hypothetical protein